MDKGSWFPHDDRAFEDEKIQAMVGDYGASGYGLYWKIVERLHYEPIHKLSYKEVTFLSFSKLLSATEKNKFKHSNIKSSDVKSFIQDCIEKYELFETDTSFFWSGRAMRNITRKVSLSEKRAEIGRKGGQANRKQ